MQSTHANPTRHPITTAVGAIIDGVDLREPLSSETVSFIRLALLDHGVVFFHHQNLSDAQMHAFVSHFGGERSRVLGQPLRPALRRARL